MKEDMEETVRKLEKLRKEVEEGFDEDNMLESKTT